MTLNLKHFDCRLNQWIEYPSNESGILTEKLENTLLEKFFPDGGERFSFGHIDEFSKPEELKNHPLGDVLLLSSGDRLLYGPPEYLAKIEEICPDPKDRGAYGSLFLGPCKESINSYLNILIVDDEGVAREDQNGNPTGEWEVEPGENGGILPKQSAFKLVGDCHGKIAPQLAAQLAEGKTTKVIQHRLQFGESRFGKGTVAPWDFENLAFTDAEKKPHIDIILPLSSFKGGDQKNDPIQPGLYENIPIWMGRKDLSPDPNKSKTAASQVLASAPEGIQDFLEEIELAAIELRDIQNDPRQLAQKYVKDYETRKASISEESSENIEESSESTEEEKAEEQFMYRLIKADLESGHPQLLETQKVQNELQRFLQNKWRDIAIGKSVKFSRGLIIPSKNLKEGEICDTRFPEGEELLNFRSPYLNSNGMCININKYVPEAYAPNGSLLEGVIVVSDETLNRIAERFKNEGITDPLPVETESQRQGRDFDGDTIGVEKASKYPRFTNEIKRRNAPGNAYAPTKKEKKISFTDEEGKSWEFTDIAHFMSDGISVGRINNFVTAVEALESEGEFLKQRGSYKQKLEYIQKIATRYSKLIEANKNANNDYCIPEQFRERMEKIVEITQEPQLSEAGLNRAFDLNRSIYRNLIEEGCYENQIAVDMFKSARAPNMEKIDEYRKLLHRKVEYIRDKKDKNVYTSRNNQHRGIVTNGFSPVELVIDQTNEIFQTSALETRPTVQFQKLFDKIFSPQQHKIAEQQKSEFDKLFNKAVSESRALEEEKGPRLVVTTTKGREIEISNILKPNHPAIFPDPEEQQPIPLDKIRLEPLSTDNKKTHRLIASSPDKDGLWQKLGTICEDSRLEHNLQAGGTAAIAGWTLKPGLDKRVIKLKFNQAFEKLENWTNSILNPDERLQFTAASWHVGTKRESSQKNKSEEDTEENPDYKISNFSFYAFKDELIDRVASYQISEFDLAGLNKEAIAELGDAPIPVKFIPAEKGRVKLVNSEEKFISYISQVGPQLPLESEATGTIELEPAATALLSHHTLPSPIKINKISQGDFAQEYLNLNNETIEIRLEKPTYPALTLNGKSLGKLDKDSVETLEEAGVLKESISFPCSIKTEGSGNKEKAVITTRKGNILKTSQGFSSYKNQKFNGEQARVSIQFIEQYKSIPIIYINGRKLGEVSDRASREILEKAGLSQDHQILEKVAITPNTTKAQLKLDPETIKYPELGQWVKRNIPEPEKSTTPLNASQQFRLRLTQKPSLSYQTAREMGLVVDRRLAPRTLVWLRSSGVGIHIPDPATTQAETARGYQVFVLNPQQLPEKIKAALASNTGKPLQHDGLGSPYRQELFKQTPVKKSQLNQLYPAPMEAGVLEATSEPLLAETIQVSTNTNLVETPLNTETHIQEEIPKLELHTDGSCLDNPGPGGWGAIIIENGSKSELSGEIGETTNNRAELIAAIEGLKAISTPSNIQLYSDSQYLTNTINEGWKRNSNTEEWEQLDEQLERHNVTFEWVKGHSGNPYNSRCDQLARTAAGKRDSTKTEPETTPSLNSDQQAAFEKLLQFTSNKGDSSQPETNKFLLTGEAGTGKTYLIAQYCRQLKKENPHLQISFTAPTHQAVKVLEKMARGQNLNAQAQTTHSLLGLKQQINSETGEIFFAADKYASQHYPDIVIVDETSMISKELAEKLEELPNKGTKIIFMGDPQQLPPVNEIESPVFQGQFFDKAHLSEVVRYGGEIGKTARALGHNIELLPYNWLNNSTDGQIQNLPAQDWLKETLQEFSSPQFKENKNHVRILTYTNARKNELNATVRHHLFKTPNLPEYVEGDFIRASETCFAVGKRGECALNNSEEAIIKKAELVTDPHSQLKVWNLDLEILDPLDKESSKIRIKTIANESLKDYEKQLNILKNKARHSQGSERKIAWQDFYALKEEFAKIDYGYAITVHKSQGSTYEKVAIDEGNIISNYQRRPERAKERNQLMYVALTRAKNEVITTNPRAIENEQSLPQNGVRNDCATQPLQPQLSARNYSEAVSSNELPREVPPEEYTEVVFPSGWETQPSQQLQLSQPPQPPQPIQPQPTVPQPTAPQQPQLSQPQQPQVPPQAQPAEKPSQPSLSLPPLADGFKPELLAEQARRTQEVAPVIAALLNVQQSTDYQGKHYRATWNRNTRELKLFDTSEKLKTCAIANEEGEWEPQPLPWDENPIGLSDGDLEKMRSLAPKLQKQLADQQRAQKPSQKPPKDQQEER